MIPSTLMPISRAVGLSSEVARIALPILVLLTMYCSPRRSKTVTPAMITVMLVISTPPMFQTTTSKGRL